VQQIVRSVVSAAVCCLLPSLDHEEVLLFQFFGMGWFCTRASLRARGGAAAGGAASVGTCKAKSSGEARSSCWRRVYRRCNAHAVVRLPLACPPLQITRGHAAGFPGWRVLACATLLVVGGWSAGLQTTVLAALFCQTVMTCDESSLSPFLFTHVRAPPCLACRWRGQEVCRRVCGRSGRDSQLWARFEVTLRGDAHHPRRHTGSAHSRLQL
jgi:hypothetical protein